VCIIEPLVNPTWLYVASLYGIGVWIARRARIDLPWRVALGFYLLVLLFLLRPMTGRYVSYPADVIRLITPWAEVLAPGRPPVTKYEVSNLNTHDVTMQIVPWAHQVREAWRSLHVPLWNSEAGCGYPLLANGQSSALSPLRFMALPLPLGYAMTAEAAMKLLLALTFQYLFCRRRYSDWASLAGALMFGFCTYLVAWLHFPHITAAVMFPGVLLAIDLMASGFTRRRFTFASIVFALTAIAGHPETAIHMALAAIPFAIWVTVVSGGRNFRALASIASAGIVAVFLAAPFLFPFLEALPRSQRYQELTVSPNRETPYSDFMSATLLVHPSITGHLPDERPWGPTSIESITGFAGMFAIVAAIAVGLRIIVQKRWRDPELLYLALTLLTLGAVLNWSVVSVPLHAVLGMVAHARLRFILCALLSILAAAAVDARRRESGIFILIGAAVVAAMMLCVVRTLPYPSSGARDTALLALAPSILVLLATLFFAVRGHVAVLLVAIVIELFVIDTGWNPSLPMSASYPRTPLIAALEHLRDGEPANSPFRIAGIGSALYPNTNAIFGLEDVRVHDPMANARYINFLRERTAYDPSDYYAKWNDPDSKLLELLNVRFLITDRTVDLRDRPRYEIVYDGRDGRIYRNRGALPRFFSERSTTRIAIEGSAGDRYQLRVIATQPSLIVSSIALYPGWRVRTGGRSLDPIAVNGLFLGFVVPAGENLVTVRYAPVSFYAGVVVSILTATLMAIWSFTVPAAFRRTDASSGRTLEAPR
jgi:hypothetical protein